MTGTVNVDTARQALKDWIEGGADKIVGVVRGESSSLQQFADRVDNRIESFPWREVIWLKMPAANVAKVMEGFDDWFSGHPDDALAVLDRTGKAQEWLDPGATYNEINSAFLKVKG